MAQVICGKISNLCKPKLADLQKVINNKIVKNRVFVKRRKKCQMRTKKILIEC